ncbi:hypothetical protein ACKUB1_09740 [Methanospirillum stamsii]|uniref:Uncharacterized protein n=1 Tax=Methanospirillum stamsii TaxID=1277351 RepID=A0A2V2NG45_9EURY|nr:hypothetical protein [Methanospirillum stamsii]PWR75348.1 hypothetical protein DLD82_04225 [Methanospirillum stamsii]
MNGVNSCPRCSGHAVFKIEPSGRSHKSGYFQCPNCGLKLGEVVATNAVPDSAIQEYAAISWDRKAQRWRPEDE